MPATLHPPSCFCDDCADDGDDFVGDFCIDMATLAAARSPLPAPAPKPDRGVVVGHACVDGCFSPSGCMGSDG